VLPLSVTFENSKAAVSSQASKASSRTVLLPLPAASTPDGVPGVPVLAL